MPMMQSVVRPVRKIRSIGSGIRDRDGGIVEIRRLHR